MKRGNSMAGTIGTRDGFLAAIILTAAGGTASAQDFVFSNNCGTGNWTDSCLNAGVWRNNWGSSAAAPNLLQFPGPGNSVLLAGTVNAFGTVQGGQVSNPAGATLNFNSGTMVIDALTNHGTIGASTGFNKFFVGSLFNNAQMSISQGAFYLDAQTSGSFFTNSVGGLLTIDGGSVRRNGGTLLGAQLVNQGTVVVAGTSATLAGIVVAGTGSSLWQTQAGSTLNLDSVGLSGVIRGDLAGPSSIFSSNTLVTSTTLSTTPASTQPWRWTSGTIDAGPYSLTTEGWFEASTGFNKFLLGSMVNQGVYEVLNGAVYLSPGSFPAELRNHGVLNIADGGSIDRNGSVVSQATLANLGMIECDAGTGSIGGVTLQGPGEMSTAPGATLNVSSVALSGVQTGHFGGTLNIFGLNTLAGDATLASAAGSPNAWQWSSGTINAGSFDLTISGRLSSVSGFNKFFVGDAIISSGGVLRVEQGTLFLSTPAPTTVSSTGLIEIGGGGSFNRNGGVVADARLINNGTLRATDGQGTVSGVSISGSGQWRSNAGAVLAVSSCELAGSMTGDFAGDAQVFGNCPLGADLVLATLPGASGPWNFTSGTLGSPGRTLTNTGSFRASTGFNKFFAGSLVNAPGALFSVVDGAFFLNAAAPVSLTNNATIQMSNGASINRNLGDAADATLTNHGLLEVVDGTATVSNITLNNGPAGIVRVPAGRTLGLPSGLSVAAGRIEGGGTLSISGGMTNIGATIAPGDGSVPGVLTLPHAYTQGQGGTLEVTLTSTGSVQAVDRLSLTTGGFNGAASLNGTLRIVLPGGSSTPVVNQSEHVIVSAAGGVSGSFTSVQEQTPIDGVRYQVRYTSTEAILKVLKRCSGGDLGSAGADGNFDGVLDNNDFVVFIDYFFSQDARADVGATGGVAGADGLFDNNDFVVFIDIFFAGCG